MSEGAGRISDFVRAFTSYPSELNVARGDYIRIIEW
jgi:hypothetical protein